MKRFLTCERGTQMIEFALLLPFLIFLFAGAVELGRMFYTYTTLQKSTVVGARYLSTVLAPGGTYSSADTNTATNLIVCGVRSSAADGCTGQNPIANNFTSANITITSPGTGVGTRYVTVTVTYAYQPLVFNLSNLTGVQQFTFTPAITMRYML
jgi:Flp pilus assembly protein TadG